MNKKRVMELVTDVANSAYDEAYYHEGSERTDSLIIGGRKMKAVEIDANELTANLKRLETSTKIQNY